jgi:ABC-2 type transport system permease protein
MKAIFHIARLHLTLVLQDRATFVQGFAVPAVLMLILSLALNPENFGVKIPLDVLDEDQSDLSAAFVIALHQAAGDEAVVICVYGEEANIPDDCGLSSDDRFDEVGEERLQEVDVAGTIVIPAGFAEAIRNTGTAAIDYRSDEQLNAQTVTRTTVETAIAQFNGSLAIATEGVNGVEVHFGGYQDDAERLAAFDDLRTKALVELGSPPVLMDRESSGNEDEIGFGARQSVPGISSMFVLFSLLSLSQFMVEERKQGTLYRLFTLPTAKTNIVLGKILGAFAFGVLQFLVFVLLGAILGVYWGDDLPAVILLIMAYCLAGTALGFLLSTLVRTVDQAGAMTTLMGLILAPLGGAWWPLRIVPDFMQVIGHLSPIAWVMEGFQDLLYYNGTLNDVLPEIGALLIFALIFAAAAVWNFRYE